MRRTTTLFVLGFALLMAAYSADTDPVKVDMEPYRWVAIVAFLATFYCAWGGGANDCANSFSSTVGSGAITLRHAVYMAAVFEMAGVMLMGSHVSDTVRKKIIDINMFLDEPAELMFGMFCSILSAGLWLMLATWMGWAVSTTHTIIGSILGFGIASKGMDAIIWSGIAKIVASWILSPVISGIISAAFFLGIRNGILRKDDSPNRLINFYPILILVSIGIYSMFIIYKGSP
jgi:phosphate/sulfate permease